MRLKRDFYKDIKVCPVCKGSGILNPKDLSYKYNFCEECEGFGTYIDEEKGRLVYGLPLFVDYPARRRLLEIKVLGVAALVFAVLISLMMLF